MPIVMAMWIIEIQKKKKKCTMIYVQYKELVDRRYNLTHFNLHTLHTNPYSFI